MGENYGAAVSAPDLNNDGCSDLVVGAPMHSSLDLQDHGCVYVYLNNQVSIIVNISLTDYSC